MSCLHAMLHVDSAGQCGGKVVLRGAPEPPPRLLPQRRNVSRKAICCMGSGVADKTQHCRIVIRNGSDWVCGGGDAHPNFTRNFAATSGGHVAHEFWVVCCGDAEFLRGGCGSVVWLSMSSVWAYNFRHSTFVYKTESTI